MNREITYVVAEGEAGSRVRPFLRRRGYSAHNLATLKAHDNSIRVNGQGVFLNHVLAAGDALALTIYENENEPKVEPVELPVEIVYEDGDICVVNKPAGMPIHPSINNYDNSLANAMTWYYRKEPTPYVFRCSNRLDRDTSGLTVLAKHPVAGAILSEMGVRRDIHREYLAIVSGTDLPPAGSIDAPLGRKPGSIIERCVDPEQGETALTHYRVVERLNTHSLVALTLETGRTHQIRIHMKHLGYPLIGDYLYNPDYRYMNRQALHAARLSFAHPMTGEPLAFEARLPEDMQHTLELERKL